MDVAQNTGMTDVMTEHISASFTTVYYWQARMNLFGPWIVSLGFQPSMGITWEAKVCCCKPGEV